MIKNIFHSASGITCGASSSAMNSERVQHAPSPVGIEVQAIVYNNHNK